MRLSNEAIVSRYCHLNPRVIPETLTDILRSRPTYFRWAGADLFHVTSETGNREMVVIETNSSPSGNKSMPILTDDNEEGGFRLLMQETMLPRLRKRGLPAGELAVLFDKNLPEVSGYAASLAELTGEDVWLVPFPHDRADVPAEFRDGVLHVRDPEGQWRPIRAAMRYVTQKPWSRIPVFTKTLMLNPVIACLAGGRNKLVAAKAYDFYNADLIASGLEIRTPETVRDLRKAEIPLWVNRFGGFAVIKVPYSNAGQGVYTIVGPEELDAFMALEHDYDQFIVQALIGNHRWSSLSRRGRLYQVGTVPNKRGDIYVADLRMMVCAGPKGFRPLSTYARRARSPLPLDRLDGQSWDVLGTNLSSRVESGWNTDADRLMLMDSRDFNRLGLGLDDLIEAYIQTVLSVVAIDRLAVTLVNQKGRLRKKLYRSLNNDPALIDELMPASG
jgi:hypothetical protein